MRKLDNICVAALWLQVIRQLLLKWNPDARESPPDSDRILKEVRWERQSAVNRQTSNYLHQQCSCRRTACSTWLCRALSSACGAAARPFSTSVAGLYRWRALDTSVKRKTQPDRSDESSNQQNKKKSFLKVIVLLKIVLGWILLYRLVLNFPWIFCNINIIIFNEHS